MVVERKTDTVALRKLMIDKNFKTVISLSMASGVDRNTLGKVLSGECQPSADTMGKLIQSLEINSKLAGGIFLEPTYLLRKSRFLVNV